MEDDCANEVIYCGKVEDILNRSAQNGASVPVGKRRASFSSSVCRQFIPLLEVFVLLYLGMCLLRCESSRSLLSHLLDSQRVHFLSSNVPVTPSLG